jgi:YHS domain-containing protein
VISLLPGHILEEFHMRIARVVFALAAFCLFTNLLIVRAEPAKEAKAAKLPLCPIMDEPVNFYVHAETKDGPVYFCCKKCIADFEKEPAKYSSKVEAQRKALHELASVQVACPISGHAVDGKTTVEEKGHTIGFCCKRCPAEFKKDPAKYHSKLMAGFTYQTMCPVGGEKIDASASTEIDGQKVYFCCKKCIKEFEADPAKYAPKLEEQGYHLRLPKKG